MGNRELIIKSSVRSSVLVAISLVFAWGLVGCAGSGRGDLSAERAEVVSAAMGQLGTPYRYGGNDPGRGLDCSGLTQYAHLVAGVRIPRHSMDQKRAAKPVRIKSLRPGDMVFFKTGPGSYHVGIMVDKDRFVHASTSKGKVRMASLNRAYWRARYLGAGTYLN